MFAFKLLLLTLVLLNSVGNIVSPGCPNCEAPYGPYCCKTSHRGTCCEYPLSTEDEDFARTPLARHTWLDNEDLKKDTDEETEKRFTSPTIDHTVGR